MNFIKEILIDAMNGFSFQSIPLFLFQLLAAGLLSYIFGFFYSKKLNSTIPNRVLIAVVLALLASLTKYSLPFSVLAAGIIIAFYGKVATNRLENILILSIGAIGVGCGMGSVVQTGIAVVVAILVLIFTPIDRSDEAQV